MCVLVNVLFVFVFVVYLHLTTCAMYKNGLFYTPVDSFLSPHHTYVPNVYSKHDGKQWQHKIRSWEWSMWNLDSISDVILKFQYHLDNILKFVPKMKAKLLLSPCSSVGLMRITNVLNNQMDYGEANNVIPFMWTYMWCTRISRVLSMDFVDEPEHWWVWCFQGCIVT